jgi:hypothetical protein
MTLLQKWYHLQRLCKKDIICLETKNTEIKIELPSTLTLIDKGLNAHSEASLFFTFPEPNQIFQM